MDIVDCHIHWYPSSYYEFLAKRPDYPRATRAADGWTYWKQGRTDTLSDIWFDLDEQFASMDATGHRISVISSMGILGDLDGLPAEEAREAALMINEEWAAAQRRYPGRFFAAAAVPLQDTEMAIEVLEHAVGKLDLRGVSIPGSIEKEPIDAPRLEPFYARAAELGMPLVIHPTDGVFVEPMLDPYTERTYYSLGRMVDSSTAVLRLILSGLFDRLPSLKVLHCHAGGVLPFVSGRLDKNATIASLAEPPSAYLKKMWVDTVAPNPLSIKFAVDFYGADRIFYGSDFPCWNPAAAIGALEAADLADGERDAIFTRNVCELFDLSVPAEAKPAAVA